MLLAFKIRDITLTTDCKPFLLSAGLASQACEGKGGTADNTSRNDVQFACFEIF
jgi:hypothetical protein